MVHLCFNIIGQQRIFFFFPVNKMGELYKFDIADSNYVIKIFPSSTVFKRSEFKKIKFSVLYENIMHSLAKKQFCWHLSPTLIFWCVLYQYLALICKHIFNPFFHCISFPSRLYPCKSFLPVHQKYILFFHILWKKVQMQT